MMVLDKDKVTVEQGDFVCLRTGFDRMLLEFERQPQCFFISLWRRLDTGHKR